LEAYFAVIRGEIANHTLYLGSEIDCGIPEEEENEEKQTKEKEEKQRFAIEHGLFTSPGIENNSSLCFAV
jgi:hypothetical protein